MEIKKVLVTPEMAETLMRNNKNNRPIRKERVLFYANSMKNGEWMQDTGEMIKIDINGRIIDGQHRLSAVITAGIPIFFHIAYNVDEQIFKVIDTGAMRSSVDVLSISGVQYANQISSIIKFYHLIKINKNSHSKWSSVRAKISNKDVLKTYNINPEKWQMIAKDATSFYKKLNVLSIAYMGGNMAVLCEHFDYETIYEFFNQFTTGKVQENNVIWLLREKLINDRISTKKMTQSYKNALFIKAWNYYISGKEVQRLTYDVERDIYPTLNF